MTAKLVAVALRAADGAPVGRLWHGAPVVWLGQDVAVAAMLYALDRTVVAALGWGALPESGRRSSVAARRIVDTAAWLVAIAVALAGALSVPALRVFGTPLTWMMWHAAGGALADSVRAVATASNVGGVALAVVAGGVAAAMPGRVSLRGRTVSRVPRSVGAGTRPGGSNVWAVVGAMAVVVATLGAARAVGPAGAGGLGRNAVVAPIVGAVRAAGWSRAMADRVAVGRGAQLCAPACAEPMSLALATAAPASSSHTSAAPTSSSHATEAPTRPFLAVTAPTSPSHTAAPSTSPFHGAAAGRHIVWIVLESVHADYVGLYGGRPDPAPSVTALGADGWVFDAAYTVYPESVKSLWALLCAAAPLPEATAAEHAALRRPCTALPEVLGAHGYTSSLWHSGRFGYLGMQAIVEGRGFAALRDAAALGAGERSSFATSDRALVDTVLQHVDANIVRAGTQAGPQFLMLLPASGHHPYESPGPGPRPFGETPDFRRYLSDVYMGDDAIGRLIDGFRARGLYERTLWVVSGDHGEAFFQHPGNFAHSLYLYDENVRVPLVISAPGAGLGRRRVGDVVSTIDIAPTILDLVGIEASFDEGDGDAVGGRGDGGSSALGEVERIARFFTDHTTLRMGLRDGDWKLITSPREGEVELYDLARDPGERRNVAHEHIDRVAAYQADLDRWLSALRAVYSEIGDR